MSYAALVFFKDDKTYSELKFRNSWGGAARVWTSLYDKYLKDPSKPSWDSWLTSGAGSNPNDRRLWDLAKDPKLSLCERAVHTFTFDGLYVARANFQTIANHLREFNALHPVESGVENHLPSWAYIFEVALQTGYFADVEYSAIALHGTSVMPNPWWLETGEEGVFETAREPYDLRSSESCWEVYEALEEWEEERRLRG